MTTFIFHDNSRTFKKNWEEKEQEGHGQKRKKRKKKRKILQVFNFDSRIIIFLYSYKVQDSLQSGIIILARKRLWWQVEKLEKGMNSIPLCYGMSMHVRMTRIGWELRECGVSVHGRVYVWSSAWPWAMVLRKGKDFMFSFHVIEDL